MPYTGRFAPSPTGALHLGTARTALLAWARARAAGGRFLLRIEDLDQPRTVAGAEAAILQDLRWLGLDWDGEPVRQSERAQLYADALERLRREGRAFACSCSRREVEQSASAPHDENGVRYPGTCRQAPLHPGRPLAWRFRMDAPEPLTDLACGPYAGIQDDFVLRRAEGGFNYQMACAVDDLLQGVSEVVRGVDLLGSASRQQALHKALGAPPPLWYHVPLLEGPDGFRLSKRHGSISVAAYREAGWSPQRLGGLLAASLGWAGDGEAMQAAGWIGRVGRPLQPRRVPLDL
jgi:glutamyl-tRNA synthetase